MKTSSSRFAGKSLVLLAASSLLQVSLAACTSPMQQQASADQQAYQAYLAQTSSCFAEAFNKPLDIQIALHLAFGGPAEDTEAMRTDASYPSIDDAVTLQTLKITASKCSTIGTFSPRLAMQAGQATGLNDLNLTVLIERQESWGEYVTTRDTISYELGQYVQSLTSADLAGQPPMQEGWSSFAAKEHAELISRANRIAPRRACRPGFEIDCPVLAEAF